MEANLSNVISALSVLFGVAVFHMGVNATKVKEILALQMLPDEQRAEKIKRRGNIQSAIIFSALPNFFMLAAIVVVMAPLAVKHIITMSISFWDFNFLITLYQIIWFIVCFYGAASAIQLFQLIYKWSQFW